LLIGLIRSTKGLTAPFFRFARVTRNALLSRVTVYARRVTRHAFRSHLSITRHGRKCLPFPAFAEHNPGRTERCPMRIQGRKQMKKLALGLILAAFSTGVFAQAETAGAAATGAGGAAGAAVVTTNAALIAAGVAVAGAAAAGSKTESTTSH
jgi:hypothetical protein